MEEVRAKMRSRNVVSFRCSTVLVEGQDGMVTGSIYFTTDDNSEIVYFQAVEPIAKTDFLNRFAALETALNETWFEVPVNVEYRG